MSIIAAGVKTMPRTAEEIQSKQQAEPAEQDTPHSGKDEGA